LTAPAAPWMGGLEARQAAPAAPPPKVRLIATGGTISNRAGGRLTADELVKSLPDVERYARPESEQFANVSSSELTLKQWLALSRHINELFQKDADLAGVVVSSGTDTLEETAYFLNLTVRSDKPVVVVGSMRNPSTLGYEGAANLLAAFRVAADPGSRGRGTLVVLNDEITAARDVTKTDALRLQTFQTRGYGILGVVDFDRVAYYRNVVKRHTKDSEFDVASIEDLPRVDIVLVYQDASGDLIKALVDQGAKGLVIATAGAGAMSGTQADGVRYAVEKGVFVVVTTRAGSGRIAAGFRRGAGYRIAGEDLQPVKARILLMLALATTKDAADIQRIFTEY
jgi:L-asparaginase